MILIVSHPGDDHAVGVLAALEREGHSAAMIDTAQFPSNASLTQFFEDGQQQFQYVTIGRTLDLGACHAGWWRRPQPFTLEPGIASEVTSFTYTECHEAMAGLWAALDIRWVNPPELDEAAHHKPYQLAVAARVGLPIPRTVITNDPVVARRFIAELGPDRTVYKTFLASEQCWRETRLLRLEEMALLDRVRLAPVIFQEYVPAVGDVRATVVGETIFATGIRAASGGYELDYRMDLAGARFEATTLPSETVERLRAFMRRLGLTYGAVDLRQSPNGTYVFLEVNPAGEWRFIEERSGQPITECMAALLARLDRQGASRTGGREQRGNYGYPSRSRRDRATDRRPPGKTR